MDKSLQKMNQPNIVSGVALLSTAALSVYTVKNTVEINKKLDEIYEDLNKIKNYVSENQRKNNINTATLSKRLEDFQSKMNTINHQEVYVDERPVKRIVALDTEDEIDDAVSKFLR